MGSEPGIRVSTTSGPTTATAELRLTSVSFNMRPDVRSMSRIDTIDGVTPRTVVSLICCSA